MRIAVLSDIHSNFLALESVLKDSQSRGVDDYWFIGDAVGYGPQPVETLNALRKTISIDNWLMGNHDALFANRLHPGGFRCEGQIMMNHNRQQLEQAMIADSGLGRFVSARFTGKLEIPKQKYIDGLVFFLTHSGISWKDYNYYYFDSCHSNDIEKKRELFGQIVEEKIRVRNWNFWQDIQSAPRILFFGHTHLPVVAYIDPASGNFNALKIRKGLVDLKEKCKDSKIIALNPGSVGFPKDRLKLPSYIVFDTKKKTVEFCRVETYDYRAFDSLYSSVKKNIELYIRDGLWRKIPPSSQNGESYENFQVTKMDAKKCIERIQHEVIRAPHPRNDFLCPDFRTFYDDQE